MLLIADSGSTKTDWCLAEEGRIVRLMRTQGINPFHQSTEDMALIIEDELLPQLGDNEIGQVRFYGSGCRGELAHQVESVMCHAFPAAVTVEVCSDLLAAARAVCGDKEGVACILGTGANSCLYDGSRIVDNTPPLGYILGDEGSGAVLGRLFINAIFKGQLSGNVRDGFLREYGLSLDDIIHKVYREPLANRFLASVSLYIRRHLDNPQLRQMVVDNFRDFFRKNVSRYGRRDLPVGAIGSVAYYYSGELAEAAAAEGVSMGVVMRSPIEGLVSFHS